MQSAPTPDAASVQSAAHMSAPVTSSMGETAPLLPQQLSAPVTTDALKTHAATIEKSTPRTTIANVLSKFFLSTSAEIVHENMKKAWSENKGVACIRCLGLV